MLIALLLPWYCWPENDRKVLVALHAGTRAGKRFGGVQAGDSITGVDILDLPPALRSLMNDGKAVIVASKGIPQLTGADRAVKLVNVKKGEASVLRAVRGGEQIGIINEKNREKVLDPKHYRAMTCGSVGLRKVKAVKFV